MPADILDLKEVTRTTVFPATILAEVRVTTAEEFD